VLNPFQVSFTVKRYTYPKQYPEAEKTKWGEKLRIASARLSNARNVEDPKEIKISTKDYARLRGARDAAVKEWVTQSAADAVKTEVNLQHEQTRNESRVDHNLTRQEMRLGFHRIESGLEGKVQQAVEQSLKKLLPDQTTAAQLNSTVTTLTTAVTDLKAAQAKPRASSSSSAKAKAKAKSKAADAPPGDLPFDHVVIEASGDTPGDLVLGPKFNEVRPSKLKKEIKEKFKLSALPEEQLTEITDFVNRSRNNFKVHLFGRQTAPVTERPKLVYGIPESDGGLGIYSWGQVIEEYGRVEPAPAVIKRLVDWMSDHHGLEDDERFNHCMLTLHLNGSCGIPPHNDSAHSKDASKASENAAMIVDLSLGASRSFFLVPNELKNQTCLETVQESSIASLKMTHGSFLALEGEWNEKMKHCVPHEVGIDKPRVSIVFRRVDKRFLHPTESKERSFKDTEWKQLKRGKEDVQVRRQHEESAKAPERPSKRARTAE
jgi:hypothetical protein